MKKITKLLSLFFIMILFTGTVNAKPFNNPVKKAFRKSDVSRNALIGVSFKDISTGKGIFSLNSKYPMSPASTQKLITILPVIDTLGMDYEFKTRLYRKGNDLYIKLGADPYFTKEELKAMIKTLHDYNISSIDKFYVDDSILDNVEWGEGWQWDNDLNSLMPKFGAYNMDRNLITVDVCPTRQGAPATISTEVFYPLAFINKVITGRSTNVRLDRKNFISPDVITAEGTVSHDLTIDIPINYPRRYFILRTEEILRKQKIAYYGDFDRKKVSQDLYLISESKHSFKDALCDILKNSNNMMAETVFKIAGGKYSNSPGSAESAIKMLNDYYKKLGISTKDIKIVDGSGVSKNNLLTADFITEVLVKKSNDEDFETFKSYMAQPGEGTLSNRMLYFKNKLRAKTGTLTNVSALAGYLTAKSGKTYAFAILINDPCSKSADKKAFEEYLLREAFDSL